MSDEQAPVVRCGTCRRVLAEPANIPVEERRPCPWCGGITPRSYELTLGTSVSSSAVIEATTGTLRLDADPPKVVIEQLEDAGFDVQWLSLPGGAWLVRVFDRKGEFIDGAMADDPQDAILAVSEKLVPPGR